MEELSTIDYASPRFEERMARVYASVSATIDSMVAARIAAAAAPPPLPSEPSYYIAVNGGQTGPFQGHALHDEIAAGRLHSDALVWAAGMAAWTKASDVPAIARLFDVAPPPVPGSPPPL